MARRDHGRRSPGVLTPPYIPGGESVLRQAGPSEAITDENPTGVGVTDVYGGRGGDGSGGDVGVQTGNRRRNGGESAVSGPQGDREGAVENHQQVIRKTAAEPKKGLGRGS